MTAPSVRMHGVLALQDSESISNFTLPLETQPPASIHPGEAWLNTTNHRFEIVNQLTNGLPVIQEVVYKSDLHNVALTGDYTQLNNRPTVPSKLSELLNDVGFVTQVNAGVTSVNNQTGAVTVDINSMPAAQAGYWRDLPMEIIVKGNGSTSPVWAQMNSIYSAYQFQVGHECWTNAHINHDYKMGTGIYLHIHFTTSGISTRPVVWEFNWSAAKGHNQANYDMVSNAVTVTTTPHGTAYRHYVAEIALPIESTQFEPDTIIRIHLKRIANGGVENNDPVFVDFIDAHYQTDRVATIHRSPNFFG